MLNYNIKRQIIFPNNNKSTVSFTEDLNVYYYIKYLIETYIMIGNISETKLVCKND